MIAAVVYLVWAATYMTMLQIVWFELSAGRRRGWLNHAYETLNRLAFIYYATAAGIALTPTELSGCVPGLHAMLLAAGNLAAVLIGSLFRHLIRFLPVAAPRPSRRWLVANYGAALPGAALAGLVLVLPPARWPALTLGVHVLVFATLAVGVYDVRRLEQRGAWPARSQPDVVIGNLIALAGWLCGLAGMAGLATALARGVEPGPLWLPLLRSGVSLAAVGAFAVRILEQVFRRLVVVLALVAAAAGFFAAYNGAARIAEPETRRLVRLAAVWLIVLVLPVAQTWLRNAVDRIVLRRSRTRQDELLGALHDVSPDLGIEGCCRRALVEVARVMQLRGAAIFLADHAVAEGDFPLERVRRVWPLVRTVWPHGPAPDLPARVFAPRDVGDPTLSRLLLDEGILLTLPVASREQRWGHLLIIPGRILGTLLSAEDVRTLESFADQLALVLDAAALLQRALEVERSLAHAAKLAAIGETAARLAHDIRNPVTAARSLAQQLCREAPGTLAEPLHVILAELERVERQVAAILRFARRDDVRPTRVDLGDLVHATVEAVRPRLDANAIGVDLALASGVTVDADPEKLRHALLNLVENAADALASTPGARRLTLAVENGRESARLRVSDNGPGVPPDALPRLFEPFFSLKATGTGLGLAIVKRTVEAHGGRVAAGAASPTGLTVEIELPCARDGGEPA
jgi:signal transduction histidine kinase